LLGIAAVEIPKHMNGIKEPNDVDFTEIKADLITHWHLYRFGQIVQKITIDSRQGMVFHASARTYFGIPFMQANYDLSNGHIY